MANTPRTIVRAEPDLIRDAADRAGLPPGTPISGLIRYCLAVVAGRPDPHSVVIAPPGPKSRRQAAA